MESITEFEIASYIRMEKHCKEEDDIDFPTDGKACHIDLVSADNRDEFILDIRSGSIELNRVTYQNRVRKTIQLVRLDINGRSHQNPDGVDMGGTHLHIYREGYADKWAQPVPEHIFNNTQDKLETLNSFMDYCSIITKPHIRLQERLL